MTETVSSRPVRSPFRIYLAGPEVFLPDASACFDAMEARCRAAGVRGVRPSDGGLAAGSTATGRAMARRIYEENVELVRGCDAVVANLMPFRGAIEPDSGTVFEIGVAVALGKPVAAWLPEPALPYSERVRRHLPTRRDATGALWDEVQGMLVEGFGEPLNLMLSCSTRLFPTFDEALAHVCAVLGAGCAAQARAEA
jgi:nucleoside 2-deoxyribosyltransferase